MTYNNDWADAKSIGDGIRSRGSLEVFDEHGPGGIKGCWHEQGRGLLSIVKAGLHLALPCDVSHKLMQ